MLAWYLALRYLTRRRTAWLAVAAVAITVAVPVVVLGVMQGWVDIMRAQVRAAEADLTVVPRGQPFTLPAAGRLGPELAAREGIRGAAPFIRSLAIATPAETGDRLDARYAEPFQVDGIDWQADTANGRLDADLLHQRPVTDLSAAPLSPTERGTGFITRSWREELAWAGLDLVGIGPLPLPPRSPPRGGIVLGRELLYANWQLGLGTAVSIVLPNGTGGTVGRIQAEISDTMTTGVIEIDQYGGLLPLAQAQRLTNKAGDHPAARGQPEIDGYRLMLEDPGAAESMADAIAADTGLRVETWRDRRGNTVKNFEIMRNVLVLVMVLVQLTCVFIIYAVFSTLVAEKRHDIGVLLGIGAEPGRVTVAFLLAGQIACLVGGAIGWGIGWGTLALLNPVSEYLGLPLFPQEVIYTPRAPISWNPLLPAFFLAVVAVIGFLATLLPAWRAGRVDPVETLREAG